MELFGYIGWISIPEFIMQFVSFPVETLDQWVAAYRLYWWIILGVGLGLFLVGVVFGGIGLYKLGKRAGIKYAWIGFFPFANTYLTGKLAGETRVFNTRVKQMGLWAMLVEILFVALNIFDIVLQLLLLRVEYFSPVTSETTGQILEYAIDPSLVPNALHWMVTASNVLFIVEYIFAILVIFVFCMLFMAFYRKYYARSPFMMTFLSSVLPGRGFAIFAVRNNPPVDYNAYLRRRAQAQQYPYGYPPQYGPQGPQYGPQGPQYGPQNPQYGPQGPQYGPQGGTQGPPAPEPFSDFGGSDHDGQTPPSNDSPFSDF